MKRLSEERRGTCRVLADRDLPDAAGGVPCCDGYAYRGPGGCTCWETVHDLPQSPPDLSAGPPVVRPTMCGTCAFRPGSPEQAGDEQAAYDAGDLEAMVANPAAKFWCHDGMRLATAQRHPNGAECPLTPDGDAPLAYDPPVVDGVGYRADGQPAFLCAGLAAARQRAARKG